MNYTEVEAKRQGFTLIELMIVMIIMGVLAAIGVQAFISSTIKGRDTVRKESLKSIAHALEFYYSDKLQYPADDGLGGVLACWTTGGAAPNVCEPKQRWQDSVGTSDIGSTIYMSAFPSDPVSSRKFYYKATQVNGFYAKYQLYAHLENSQDSLIDPLITAKGYNCATTGTAICNWGISSTNTTPSE